VVGGGTAIANVGPVRQLLSALGPDGFVSALAVAGLLLCVTAIGGPPHLEADGIAPLVLLAVLLASSAVVRLPLLLERRVGDRARFGREQLRAARAWVPFVVAYVSYRVIVASMNGVVGAGVEDRLRALDEALLGVSPSFWMQRFVSPWLTELMAFAYGLMFFLPLGVLLYLCGRERWHEFRIVALSVLAAFYLGLVGYLLVPARSPRLCYTYDVELHGVFGLYEASSWAWDSLQAVTYDAFPSLHTAISTISLIWAWRLAPRALFLVYVPCVILLQISTLYLRQHYFVDLVGGWGLALLAVWLAPRLWDGWTRALTRRPRNRIKVS
jgi:membrane-associated phospholipid phosphatase